MYFSLLRYNSHIMLYQLQVHNIECIYYEMTITISLVNIYHQTQLQFFFLARTFKINLPQHSQIHNTVLAITTKLYITSCGFLICITRTLYLLTVLFFSIFFSPHIFSVSSKFSPPKVAFFPLYLSGSQSFTLDTFLRSC